LISILLILTLVVSLSGCIQLQQNWANDAGACCVLSVIGLVLFIILIAYLLGGKKTVVQTTQTAPSPPVVIHEVKSERRCPECGRVIPFDARMCPYCGKKFKEFAAEEKMSKCCPLCGFENKPESKFCKECGNKL